MADEKETSEQTSTAEENSTETTDHSPDAAQVGTSDGDGESS